jgi:hypothetical protein
MFQADDPANEKESSPNLRTVRGWEFVSLTVARTETRTRRNVGSCRYEAGQTGQMSWIASGVHLVHQDAYSL